jgi:hypothetical protein
MEHVFLSTTTIAAVPCHVSCDLAGEAVILQLQDGVYYGLNTVGARVWQLLQQPTTRREIVSHILNDYEVEPARVEQDIAILLRDLSSRRLIEVRYASGEEASVAPRI